jgi:hypothetical protein
MATQIVPRIATLDNGDLPVRAGDKVAKPTEKQLVAFDFGHFWSSASKFGFAGMLLCWVFYRIDNGVSAAGENGKEAVIWTAQNVVKPMVENQSDIQKSQTRSQELFAEALQMVGESNGRVDTGLGAVVDALKIIHQDNQARLESDAKTHTMLDQLMKKIDRMP